MTYFIYTMNRIYRLIRGAHMAPAICIWQRHLDYFPIDPGSVKGNFSPVATLAVGPRSHPGSWPDAASARPGPRAAASPRTYTDFGGVQSWQIGRDRAAKSVYVLG